MNFSFKAKVFWLAASEVHAWLAEICLLSLFGEYQFVVAGDSQAVHYSVMEDDDLVRIAKEFGALDCFLCHA
jgi:hypothetical protein